LQARAEAVYGALGLSGLLDARRELLRLLLDVGLELVHLLALGDEALADGPIALLEPLPEGLLLGLDLGGGALLLAELRGLVLNGRIGAIERSLRVVAVGPQRERSDRESDGERREDRGRHHP
jgi:hypothetical protein